MPANACHTVPVSTTTAIDVAGADAESFLAGQLSQRPPASGRAPLAAWHDAKGRVQAVFRVLRRDDGGFRLLTHSSVAEAVAAALGRYVLRAQVRIGISTEGTAVAAFLGDCAERLGEAGVELGAQAGALTERGGVAWLRLGPDLVHAVGPAARFESPAAGLPAAGADAAELAEIRLGLPAVSAPLSGLFLPQMLNLDLLGGIAFDKGCYPGQEVIARTQNLGAVKRRMRRFTRPLTDPLPMPGSCILDAAGTEVGMVVRAARADTGIELLAVVQLAALAGPLVHEHARQTPLRAEALPYATA